MFRFLAVLAVISVQTFGCASIDEATIEKMIEDRLVAEALISPPVTGTDEAAIENGQVAVSNPTENRPAESLGFLSKLDKLMADYEPVIPPVTDNTDLFRCVTADSFKNNPTLKDMGRTVKKRQLESERARREQVKAFNRSLPQQFRIDYNWKARKRRGPPIYSCWVAGNYRGHWADECKRHSECRWVNTRQKCYEPRYKSLYTWKYKSPGPFVGPLYTNGPPELMQRIKVAKLKIPSRFYCQIGEVRPIKKDVSIECGPGANIRIQNTENLNANIGDVVSFPLYRKKIEPFGVLAKQDGKWTVYATRQDMKIEQQAECPTIQEIAAGLD